MPFQAQFGNTKNRLKIQFAKVPFQAQFGNTKKNRLKIQIGSHFRRGLEIPFFVFFSRQCAKLHTQAYFQTIARDKTGPWGWAGSPLAGSPPAGRQPPVLAPLGCVSSRRLQSSGDRSSKGVCHFLDGPPPFDPARSQRDLGPGAVHRSAQLLVICTTW